MIFGFLYLLNCVVLSVFAGHKVKFILSPCPCVGLFVQRHSLVAAVYKRRSGRSSRSSSRWLCGSERVRDLARVHRRGVRSAG